MMKMCWAEQPENRPTFKTIIKKIQSLNNGKSQTLVDNMIERLEGHTKYLENIVAER